MKGTNPVAHLEHDKDGLTLSVQEIFRTIQGEGPFAGMPSVFLRTAGCGLQCSFCFPGNARVVTEDGARFIKDLVVGDRVITKLKDGAIAVRPITKVYQSFAEDLVILKLDRGGTREGQIAVTPEHPIWVIGKGWTPAGEVKEGDVLFSLRKKERQSNNVKFKAHIERHLRGKNNPMTRDDVAMRSAKNRVHRKSDYELRVEEQTKGLFEYVAGDLFVGRYSPDFRVVGKPKVVVDVWDPTHKDLGYREKLSWRLRRKLYFKKKGYSLHFMAIAKMKEARKKVPYGEGVRIWRQQVKEAAVAIAHNGRTVVGITRRVMGENQWKHYGGTSNAPCLVYNLEVEEGHTYFVSGVLVHNCDTSFDDGKDMSVDAIAKTVKQFIAAWKNPLVVITGGEPLRQNIIYLCDVLLQLGCHVQIETAGYCWPPNMSKELGIYFHSKHLTVVCSPKTPVLHNEVKRWCRDWKYIVSAKDGICGMRPGMDVTNNFDLLGTIWLQPRDDGDEIENKRNVAEAVKLCDRYGYRLSLQTHKIIGVP